MFIQSRRTFSWEFMWRKDRIIKDNSHEHNDGRHWCDGDDYRQGSSDMVNDNDNDNYYHDYDNNDHIITAVTTTTTTGIVITAATTIVAVSATANK